jgi:hypothetical protein
MVQENRGASTWWLSPTCGISTRIAWIVILAAALFSARPTRAQNEQLPIDDTTAKYHFLSTDDTLAILDQEGRLKGYIEVTQPADESDDILTYDIVEGSRQKNHVEFRTNRIHGKYYRFSGTAERGKGHEEKDSDYLHLAGSLDVVTVNSETGKESVLVMRMTFKSIGKAERPDD